MEQNPTGPKCPLDEKRLDEERPPVWKKRIS